ncbi:MAG: Retron-type reverse transcriptase [Candidatus Woesebacteria bacterium GW2011_GWA2_40_7b]|uniref:Retron-type reverse transcriptase n=1 Tax=Candidatus Woesebacteria bacterium GW2011_GWA2_40_7b TaxID=1618563 RepID=A0A0G0T1P1_9BACT|nr:MAG: Retron-type reverse transcriptase [Candidatus Woesebacteria bacterium GW2011_GWA2_40_7b]
MKIYTNVFEKIVSPENLFNSWTNFKHDKRKRPDVQEFEISLEQNIFELHRELKAGIYRHGLYKPFYIHDPKQRLIHKATVRDRVVHHAIYSVLNLIFEPTFIANSFSCRIGKGTHKGVEALKKILRKASRNNTGNCFALKCDIKKFFDSIDHPILLDVLAKRIKDERAMSLLTEIVGSFSSGLPIGNLTSQLFANIYLSGFDQFMKQELRVKYYVRYTDDFVVVSRDRDYLEHLLKPVSKFLNDKLRLSLHPQKVLLRKYGQGIDFLGYVVLPNHIVLRTKTKRRIFRKLQKHLADYKEGTLSEEILNQSTASYLGVLSHSNSFKLSNRLNNLMISK